MIVKGVSLSLLLRIHVGKVQGRTQEFISGGGIEKKSGHGLPPKKNSGGNWKKKWSWFA